VTPDPYIHTVGVWNGIADRVFTVLPFLAVGPLRHAPRALCGISLVSDHTVPDVLEGPDCPLCASRDAR
jgi:hypothetical protein